MIEGEAESFSLATVEERACTAIFAGVLHNDNELREALTLPREEIPDPAALILQAYLQWGKSGFAKLRGIFSLFLWDGHQRLFFGARDPLGIAPLFYAVSNSELVFSRSIQVILAHPHVSKIVNRAAVADHLRHRWPRSEETFFANIKRVPPGHAVEVVNGNRRTLRYWDPSPPGTMVQWLTDDELERFDVVLDQAVQRSLTFGPAAIYLSGGLDSVSVAAVATEHCQKRGLSAPLALSLVFPDADCNEETIQKGVARTLGLSHALLEFDKAVGEQGLLLAALETSRSWPIPLLNTYYPAYHQLGTLGQQKGFSTILTGSGGDEWLCVSPYYAADLLRSCNLPGLYRLWDTMCRSYPLSHPTHLRAVVWRFGVRLLLGEIMRKVVPSALDARKRLFQAPPQWLAADPDLRQELVQRAEETGGDPNIESLYVREMRRALDHPLVSWEMEELFESGRRLRMAILSPFWDADVVELLYRTPPELLNRGNRTKGLVRQTIARRFPDLGFEWQKKVIATKFFASRMLTEGCSAWQAMGGVPALQKLGIVDARAVSSTIMAILSQKQERTAFRLWDILNLEVWLRARV
jgi:asparagine synthase (glutamine-hydrolysing)